MEVIDITKQVRGRSAIKFTVYRHDIDEALYRN